MAQRPVLAFAVAVHPTRTPTKMVNRIVSTVALTMPTRSPREYAVVESRTLIRTRMARPTAWMSVPMTTAKFFLEFAAAENLKRTQMVIVPRIARTRALVIRIKSVQENAAAELLIQTQMETAPRTASTLAAPTPAKPPLVPAAGFGRRF